MKTTVIQFPLRAWRTRMQFTQVKAAAELGLSPAAYRASEYRNDDRPAHPCNKTVALLAMKIEQYEGQST